VALRSILCGLNMAEPQLSRMFLSIDLSTLTAMNCKTFGYMRVSTNEQSLDQQLDALKAAGVSEDCIYADKMSGVRNDRPGLTRLLEVVREGDVVVVVALDRLGRSLTNMLHTIEILSDRGVQLRSLREDIDFSTPTGRLMASIFGSLAEYERRLIAERASAAREAAAARGRRTGRPRALSDDQVRVARRMSEAGESISMIARTLGVSRSTIYRSMALAAM
jgi:DNA invertase Pin-like site-specific DNA recombinase